MNDTFSYKFMIISFIVSLGVGLVVYLYFPFYNIKGANKALDGMLLLSSISLGFYGACLSVLASIFNTNVMKDIMKEKEEKREFIVISCFTLLTGFFTVIITIVYQVMLFNGEFDLQLINFLWFMIVFLFFCMKVLFILVVFMILFNNKDNNNKPKVFEPDIK